MRTLVLFMFLTVGCTMPVCAQENTVSKKEVAAFLNWLYDSSASMRELRFIDRTNPPPEADMIRRHDSVNGNFFTEEDFAFMEEQVRRNKSVVLDNSYVQHANFLRERKRKKTFSNKKKFLPSKWADFYKKYGAGYCRVSYPIFNLKKDLCIIYVVEMRGGVDGSGSTIICKKVGDSWKIHEIIDQWVS